MLVVDIVIEKFYNLRNKKVRFEKFIHSLVEKYGKHTVYTNGGTWYPEACNILKLKHYLDSSIAKSLMERVNQYFKDRTELFDYYYSCGKNECNIFKVHN